MQDNIITVSDLTYRYQQNKVLDKISFSIKKGSITALVGPNGAGKTTLLRCIASLEEPFSGKIIVDSLDTREFPRKIHSKIGYLSDFFGVYKDLTVQQSLHFMALIHNIENRLIQQAIKDALELTELVDHKTKKAGELSRGLRQRLGIAMTLIHKPKILLLDEPASGLDPEARINLSKLLKNFQQLGVTIIVSSHILAELENYCTDMLVIRGGKILENVHNKEDESTDITIEIKVINENNENILSKIAEIAKTEVIKTSNNTFEFSVKNDDRIISEVIKNISSSGINLTSFSKKQKKLEEIYMTMIDKNN